MVKKMSVVMAGLLCLGLTFEVSAQWNLPTDSEGHSLAPSEAPCVAFHINNATGTAEVLIAGTAGATGNTVSKTPGYIAWVQLSTGAVTAYLDLSDTDKLASGQKYNMLPPLMFRGPALAAGAYDSAKISEPFVFKPPVLFQNGLTAKLSAADVAATVCYRKMTRQYP